jgi:hypothetical protein
MLLWIGYTVLQTLYVVGYVGEAWSAILGFVPGVIGVTLLTIAGLSREACYLTIRPLSWQGFGILAVIFVVGLAAILPVSVWQGWSWTAALIYAPASGVSQELFFRAALLPAMLWALEEHERAALILHAALFGLWHIGPLFVGAPVWAVAAVMMVPFLSGIGWGRQVMRDRTVVWAMVQHSLIWMIGLQFDLPAP